MKYRFFQSNSCGTNKIRIFFSKIADCPTPLIVGDGYCNDETNNADCNYDGGDCCGSCVVTEQCSECQCLGEIDGNGVSSPSIGDGYCQDGNNNAACNYDGGDCCLFPLNTDYCLNCTCSTSGVITSPGYPHPYDHHIDMSWIILVPTGQVISLNFDDIFHVYDYTYFDYGIDYYPGW